MESFSVSRIGKMSRAKRDDDHDPHHVTNPLVVPLLLVPFLLPFLLLPPNPPKIPSSIPSSRSLQQQTPVFLFSLIPPTTTSPQR